MALTIQFAPTEYLSVHGDLIWTVLDLTKAGDPVTYPDYKYVCDIYINLVFVAKLKAIPHPDNKVGIFNISNIVRNYLAANFNPTASQLRAQKLGLNEFYTTTRLSFGEEYGLVQYPDLVVDAVRTFFNHSNGRLIGGNTPLFNYLDKPITIRPLSTSVYRGAKFCFIPFLPTDDTTINLIIKSYNGSGLIATTTQPFTPTATSTNEQQLFNVSPDAINAAVPGFISSYVTYYTVEFNTTNITDDVTYRFNLVCEAKYEVFTIHFLNQFGGFDSREFTKVSRKTIDIEKSEFGKLNYTMDSSGQISYFNANKVYNETRSIYASVYKEKMVLNTDIQKDDEYIWMGDLVKSPMAFIEIEGYFIPIVITGSNYEFKKTINDDLTNLTINIEFGDQFNAQYR